MNCSDPNSANCAEALSSVYDYLDAEIDEARRDAVARHLEDCPPCLEQYSLERMVKSLVQRSCCTDPAPAELRVRVVARIQQIRVTYRPGG